MFYHKIVKFKVFLTIQFTGDKNDAIWNPKLQQPAHSQNKTTDYILICVCIYLKD